MSGGGSVVEAEWLAGAGVGEAEPGRVQRLAGEVQQRCGGPARAARGPTAGTRRR